MCAKERKGYERQLSFIALKRRSLGGPNDDDGESGTVFTESLKLSYNVCIHDLSRALRRRKLSHVLMQSCSLRASARSTREGKRERGGEASLDLQITLKPRYTELENTGERGREKERERKKYHAVRAARRPTFIMARRANRTSCCVS